VGQGLGAGKPDRAERAVWLAAFYNILFLGAVGAVFVLCAEPIVRLFTQDPLVAPVAVLCLRVISYGFLFYAYGMVITQSFNGAGDTLTPTLINLVCFWLWELPLAYWLARRGGLGPRGVALAVTIAFSTVAVVSALIFRRGRWKLRRV
jgi:Na+-driven multidrug efflux pump